MDKPDSSVDTHHSGASAPEAEPARVLLTAAQYARHANVSATTVGRWLRAGRITAEADGRIDPERADRERVATESPLPHHQARKAQIEAEKAARAEAPRSEADLAEAEDLGRQLKQETIRLQRAKAEAANLELDVRAGLLVERADVDFVLTDLARHLHARIANMPGALAPALARHGGDVGALHAELADFGRDLLEDLAARMAEQARRRLGAAATGEAAA